MKKITRYFGVEMTWSKPGLRIDSDGFASRSDVLEKDLREAERLVSESFFPSIDLDPGCIEFRTRILSSYSDLRKAYKEASSAVKTLGLVSHPLRSVSGGGHVTLGLPTIEELNRPFDKEHTSRRLTSSSIVRARRVTRLVYENPFIPWVFGDADDNHTHTLIPISHHSRHNSVRRAYRSSLLSDNREILVCHPGSDVCINAPLCFFLEIDKKEFLNHVNKVFISSQGVSIGWTVLLYGFHTWSNSSYPYICESPAIRPRLYFDSSLWGNGRTLPDHPSLELRFFGNPRGIEEQMLHVEFAQALMDAGDRYVPQHDDLEKVLAKHRKSIKLCKDGFKRLLDDLELDFAKYERFLDNLDRRFWLGKEHLN